MYSIIDHVPAQRTDGKVKEGIQMENTVEKKMNSKEQVLLTKKDINKSFYKKQRTDIWAVLALLTTL